jgi:hypothetical protein
VNEDIGAKAEHEEPDIAQGKDGGLGKQRSESCYQQIAASKIQSSSQSVYKTLGATNKKTDGEYELGTAATTTSSDAAADTTLETTNKLIASAPIYQLPTEAARDEALYSEIADEDQNAHQQLADDEATYDHIADDEATYDHIADDLVDLQLTYHSQQHPDPAEDGRTTPFRSSMTPVTRPSLSRLVLLFVSR